MYREILYNIIIYIYIFFIIFSYSSYLNKKTTIIRMNVLQGAECKIHQVEMEAPPNLAWINDHRNRK